MTPTQDKPPADLMVPAVEALTKERRNSLYWRDKYQQNWEVAQGEVDRQAHLRDAHQAKADSLTRAIALLEGDPS